MAYLFAWNPKQFDWKELDQQIEFIRTTGAADDRWSCGKVREIPPGSRFFMIRLGSEPRGLIGAGQTGGEVADAPHWNPERAARGETRRYVDLRWETLHRIPLIRRAELDHAPFDACHWDTQMSGVKIPEEVAQALESLWSQRLEAHARGEAPASIGSAALERWRVYLAEARSDAPWMERHRLRDEKRRSALVEIRKLVEQFRTEAIELSEFREVFDRKTRNEWDFFGLKGMSGAMFLNKLAKHLPDVGEVSHELRAAILTPADESSAQVSITRFMDYLAEQVTRGVVKAAAVQPNRTPFLLTACWHMSRPEQWPILYESARDALQADGLLGRSIQGGDGYIEFTRVFRELSERLEVSFWELEHVCRRMGASTAVPQLDDESRPASEEVPDRERVWLVAPGRRAHLFDAFCQEGIFAMGAEELGDLTQYPDSDSVREALRKARGGDVNPFQDALMCYQFAHEMQVGDEVFAKRGGTAIVGYGIVTSGYRHEPDRQPYTHVRSVDWKLRGEWIARDKPLVTKTLTEIGKNRGLVSDIRKALGLGERTDVSPEPESRPVLAYTIDSALQDLFMTRSEIENALALLRYKKNLVLQGPPGVGKTFFAKALAYALLGEKDLHRIAQVQFHPSYGYEDFVQGYRPSAQGGFALVEGPFMRFCDQALQDPELPYVLIIDEINRGNLSKIFGELLLLLEADKRSETWATTLTYSTERDDRFFVPSNLYLIGTMNTADRSLALVDYALRRRFAFVDVRPAFDSSGLARKLDSLEIDRELRSQIISRLSALNERICQDKNLGRGFCIGHSYFCRADAAGADAHWYRRIVATEIGPLLREYWFDETERAEDEIDRLLGDD